MVCKGNDAISVSPSVEILRSTTTEYRTEYQYGVLLHIVVCSVFLSVFLPCLSCPVPRHPRNNRMGYLVMDGCRFPPFSPNASPSSPAGKRIPHSESPRRRELGEWSVEQGRPVTTSNNTGITGSVITVVY